MVSDAQQRYSRRNGLEQITVPEIDPALLRKIRRFVLPVLIERAEVGRGKEVAWGLPKTTSEVRFRVLRLDSTLISSLSRRGLESRRVNDAKGARQVTTLTFHRCRGSRMFVGRNVARRGMVVLAGVEGSLRAAPVYKTERHRCPKLLIGWFGTG